MPRRAQLWFPILLVLSEVAAYLSVDMFVPAMPAIAKGFNVGAEVVQYTLVTWFLGSGTMQLVLGPVSDSIGRRPLLLMGGVLFIISSIACALAPTIGWLIFFRFFQGVAVTSLIIAGYAVIHETFSGKQAVQLLAIMGSVTIIAPSLGPLLGSLIIFWHHWRVLFWILAIWLSISTLCLAYIMPESLKTKVPLKFKPIIRDYWQILTNTQFLRFMLCYCFCISAFLIWIFESPFIIIETLGKSVVYFALCQVFVFGIFILGAQISKYLITWLCVKKLILLGLSTLTTAGFSLTLVSYLQAPTPMIVATMMLMSFGAAIIFGALNRLAIEACTAPMGRRMAIFSSFIGIAGCLGAFVMSSFDDKTFENLSWVILTCILSATLSFTLSRKPVELQN